MYTCTCMYMCIYIYIYIYIEAEAPARDGGKRLFGSPPHRPAGMGTSPSPKAVATPLRQNPEAWPDAAGTPAAGRSGGRHNNNY